MRARSPSPSAPPKELVEVDDGRFRPSLAPIRLSTPLLPPDPNAEERAGLRISPLDFFFFPPKPITADADDPVLVAVAATAVGQE